jgi:hypothetical protein
MPADAGNAHAPSTHAARARALASALGASVTLRRDDATRMLTVDIVRPGGAAALVTNATDPANAWRWAEEHLAAVARAEAGPLADLLDAHLAAKAARNGAEAALDVARRALDEAGEAHRASVRGEFAARQAFARGLDRATEAERAALTALAAQAGAL